MITPVPRRKLSHAVLEQLSALLESGAYQPGDQLPSETDLGRQFGVGRPSIREALQELQRQGAVRIAHGERPRVTEPGPDQLLTGLDPAVRRVARTSQGVRHLSQARLFLEIGLAEHAADTADGPGLDRLRAALDLNAAAVGDLPRFRASDAGFHRVLAELSGNPVLLALHEGAVAWIMNRRSSRQDAERYHQLSTQEHAAIVAAIEARDRAGAGAAMRRHLIDADHRYLPD